MLRDPGPLLPDRHLLVLLLGEEGGLVPLPVLLLLLELGDRVCGVGGDEVGGERAQLLLGQVLAVPGEHLAAGLLVEAVAEDPHREPQLRFHETFEVPDDVVPPVFEALAHQLDVRIHPDAPSGQAEEPADGGENGTPALLREFPGGGDHRPREGELLVLLLPAARAALDRLRWRGRGSAQRPGHVPEDRLAVLRVGGLDGAIRRDHGDEAGEEVAPRRLHQRVEVPLGGGLPHLRLPAGQHRSASPEDAPPSSLFFRRRWSIASAS